jgi:hypothetical protein
MRQTIQYKSLSEPLTSFNQSHRFAILALYQNEMFSVFSFAPNMVLARQKDQSRVYTEYMEAGNGASQLTRIEAES